MESKTTKDDLDNNRFELFFRRNANKTRRFLVYVLMLYFAADIAGQFVLVLYYSQRGLPIERYVDHFWATRLVLSPFVFENPIHGFDGIEYVGGATREATSKYYHVADPIRRHRLANGVGRIKAPYESKGLGWRMTNPQGFASPDATLYEVDKPAGTFRVIVLGGSTVEGDGAETPIGTLPAQLQTALSAYPEFVQNGRTVEVINAGVGGYKSSDELLYLITELLQYKPDLVVSYNGWNDLHVNRHLYITYGSDAIYFRHPHHDRMQTQLNQAYSFLGGLGLFAKGLFASLYEFAEQTATFFVIARLRERLDLWDGTQPAVEFPQRLDRDQMYSDIGDAYLLNIETMIALAGIHGFHYAAFLQPIMGVDGKRYTAFEQAMFDRNQARMRERHFFYELVRPRLAALGRRLGRTGQICVADLSDALQDVEDRVYEDGGHLLAAGNAVMAQAIARQLAQCQLLQ